MSPQRGMERVSEQLIGRYRSTRDHGLSEREVQSRLRPRTGLIAVAGAVGFTPDYGQLSASAGDTASRVTRKVTPDPRATEVLEQAAAVRAEIALGIPAEFLDDTLGVTRGLGCAVRALNEIALLQDTCPLAAAVAERGLREVKAEVAPDAELVSA